MFDNAFFKKFPQAESSFIDDEGSEKKYLFPTFYEGSRAMMAAFTCSWKKAQAQLPKGCYPTPGGLGKAVAIVSAFEYNNVQGMDPYNEILFGFPVVQVPAGSLVPKSGFYVARLVVDQPDNVQRGKHLWGMSKSLGEFKFYDRDGSRVCELWRNGRMGLKFEVPRQGRSRTFEECRYLISVKGGEILRSRSCMSGRRIEARNGGNITLGADPMAAELKGLGVASEPIFTRYMPNMNQTLNLASEKSAA